MEAAVVSAVASSWQTEGQSFLKQKEKLWALQAYAKRKPMPMGNNFSWTSYYLP